MTFVAILWLIAVVDEYFYERKYTIDDATWAINQLPEVAQYLKEKPTRWCVLSDDLDHPPPDRPDNTVEFDVGEWDSEWHKFRFSLVNGSITVFDQSRGWESLDKWRRSAGESPK